MMPMDMISPDGLNGPSLDGEANRPMPSVRPTRINVSDLAVAAFGLTPHTQAAHRLNRQVRCGACGTAIESLAIPFDAPRSFHDFQMMADTTSAYICLPCSALMTSEVATNVQASGVVHEGGFNRLSSNVERLRFFMEPPKPPFAVAIVNAKRQHVWWMAKVCYDPDLIPIQFGHRRLLIDRQRAIAAAKAVLEYEAQALSRDKRTSFVFLPISRDLKSPDDGMMTHRFMRDESPEAQRVRGIINSLSFGDLWAAQQIRAAVRELRATSPEAAIAALDTKIRSGNPV